MKRVVTLFSLRRLQRGMIGVVTLLVMASLAVAVPESRANDGGFDQVGPTISRIEEKTDVTVTDAGTSYKLGNARVDGNASKTLTVSVSNGWFTIPDWKVGGVEPTVALSDKENLLTVWRWSPSTLKNERYRHIEFTVTKNSDTTMPAQAIQQFLQGMTFWVPSGDVQTVWVSATYQQLQSYRRIDSTGSHEQPEPYDAHLFNGHAYSFVPWFDEDSETGYSKARETVFLGKSGYLMTVESKGERNAVYYALGEEPGWIGGANMVGQLGVIGSTSTTNAVRGYYVEFEGFDLRLAGQVATTSATISGKSYDSYDESSDPTQPAEADAKPDDPDAKPDTRPSEADAMPDAKHDSSDQSDTSDMSNTSDVSNTSGTSSTKSTESDTKPTEPAAPVASDADPAKPAKPANPTKQHAAPAQLANTGLDTLASVLTVLALLAAALITVALRQRSSE